MLPATGSADVPKGFAPAAIILTVVLLGLGGIRPAEAARAHLVQPGETLHSIALRYGLTVTVLARANGLVDPARIRVGQVLTIPEVDSHERHARTGNPAHISRQERAPAITYVVRPGDSLYTLARRFGITVQALIEFNRLGSETLLVGQKLRVPSATRPRATAHAKPLQQPVRATLASPRSLPPVAIGTVVKALRPLRVRSGPRTYLATVALVAAETPLRVVGEEPGWYQVQLPDDVAGWVREEDVRPQDQASTPGLPRAVGTTEIVSEALGYVGTPYLWGGHSAGGLDCSGLVYVVFAPHVPNLVRTSSFDYFHAGVPVARSVLQAGDLVFFTTYAAGPSHVGIYVGEGKFVHASSASHQVSTSSLDEPYYAARYLGARRLLAP